MRDLPKFDFLIIGSGFGGSISAMRLAQKGYSVAILEQGKTWQADDFPQSNWSIRRYFWTPLFRCFGIQSITLLKGIMVLHGVGVGGGSLVYANTLMRPRPSAFDDPAWPTGINWLQELTPYYDTASKMLGVTQNKALDAGEDIIKKLGEKLNVANTFHPTDVAIYFGKPGEVAPDPYFDGEGPSRTGCTLCGGCMIGCRHNAKNTLDKNYLYFAKKYGAQIFSERKAIEIIPNRDNSYTILTKQSTSWLPKKEKFQAQNVIVSAGVLGTVELLLKNKFVSKTLPSLSSTLGQVVRTNGESLLGATANSSEKNYSRGIAIGAAIHPDENTKIEGVRYPAGSDVMKFLGVPLTNNGSKWTRPMKLFIQIIRKFPSVLKLYFTGKWAERSLILLVMQSIDQQMKLSLGRSLFHFWRLGLRGRPTEKPVPSFIPIAQKSAVIAAELMQGEAQNIISEALLDTPATAHILGGCIMGDSEKTGVVDHHHKVFGYKGLYICDGSVVPANLGVNPSLTISALAERFTEQFPPSPSLQGPTTRHITLGSSK